MVMELDKVDDVFFPSASPASAIASLLPLASVSQQPYVSELLSFTLDRLHKEPELLRVDADRIQRHAQGVAVGNYRAFIPAADALVAIKEEASSIDKHLESLGINLIASTELQKENSQVKEKKRTGLYFYWI